MNLNNNKLKHVMVDLGVDLNIILTTTWERLGRPKLIRTPMKITLADAFGM